MYRIIQHKNVIISKCCFLVCKSCLHTYYCKVILFSKPNTYCVYVSIHNMLPWLTIYDHTKYARWGLVYLANMKLLEMTAPQVYTEFMQGNFVVKRTKRRFNQFPADQATEWINKPCKMQNGIIGITRNAQRRDKLVSPEPNAHESTRTRDTSSTWKIRRKKPLSPAVTTFLSR